MICRSRRHWTQEQGKRSVRSKSVVSIGNMTLYTYLQATIMIHLMTLIIDVSDTQKKHSKKIRSDYAQL